MGSTRPSTKADDFEGNSSIQAFLSCPINYALSTAAYLVEQLVIAEFHLHSAFFLCVVFLVIERTKSGPKQANAAKAPRRVCKDARTTLCANSFHFIRRGAQLVSNLCLYCPKFSRGLRLQYRNEVPKLIFDISGHCYSLRDFVAQQLAIPLT